MPAGLLMKQLTWMKASLCSERSIWLGAQFANCVVAIVCLHVAFSSPWAGFLSDALRQQEE